MLTTPHKDPCEQLLLHEPDDLKPLLTVAFTYGRDYEMINIVKDPESKGERNTVFRPVDMVLVGIDRSAMADYTEIQYTAQAIADDQDKGPCLSP